MCSENHLHFDYVRLAWDAGFCFEEYNTKNAFDISTLGLVDIDKVTRDRDIATVERHIPTILQFRLDEELTRILEPTFVKIFKLCQLSLQYLRFCNKYLDNTVVILKKDLSTGNDEKIHLSNTIEQLTIENSNLNIKNKELKEAFNNINQSVSYKCHECPKSFASQEFLDAHASRRHAQLQSESEKLQLEIKELKERLNSTEKYIQHEKAEPNNDAVFADKEAVLQAKFEQLKEHIEKELIVLRDESFYRSMYEKWFEEIFQKLKYETPKKVYIEQGSGDCVQVTESSTQTNIAEGCAEEVPRAMPRGGAQQEEKVVGMEEMEQRLKLEHDAQREMFEEMLELKIVGSLGKLETQMNVFGKKLEVLELKKQEAVKIETFRQPYANQEHSTPTNEEKPKQYPKITNEEKPKQYQKITNEEKPKQYPTPTKVNPSVQKSRYITAAVPAAKIDSSSESESNSESENVPPKPAQRTLKPAFEGKPIAPPRPPIRVASFSNKNKPIRVASFNKKRDPAPVEKSSDSISDDSVDLKVIKTVQKPVKVESKSKPQIRKEAKTVLKENIQRKVPKKFAEGIESGDDNIPEVKSASSKPVIYDERRLAGIKDEMEEIFNLRLKEIGVAPQWKGLPVKNYKHAISVIEHQASLSSKSIPNYSRIREEIVKSIDKNLRKRKHDLQQNQDVEQKTVHKRRSNDPRESKEQHETTVKTLTSSDAHSSSSDEMIRPPSSPDRKTATKKKVLFNLKSQDSVQTVVPRDFAGSASSLGSSVLDRNDKDGEGLEGDEKMAKRRAQKEESDWDISDIVM